MVSKIGNLIHETTTDTGAGNLTLTVVTGNRTFNTEFGTGGTNVFYYFITNSSAAEWEIGTGHLSSPTVLVRDTVISSSNANALVTFSAGTKEVTNDLPQTLQVVTENLNFSAGLSVTGRASNTTGQVADITATATNQVLRRNGTTLVFEEMNLDMLADVYSVSFNLIIGHPATSITSGDENTGVGQLALSSITSGSQNVGIGAVALQDVTTGSQNDAVGETALRNVSTGNNNVGMGFGTGDTLTTGSDNTFLGNNANVNSGSAINRIVIGKDAVGLVDNSIQLGNTSITDVYFGNGTAILHGDGSMLTGVATALDGLSDVITDYPNLNMFLGDTSGSVVTSATNSTALGTNALAALADGTSNTAVGANALTATDSGTQNVAIGDGALQSNTSGSNNVAIGYLTLSAVTSGGGSTAVGTQALTANTSGGNNVAVGNIALDANTTGSNNTGIGTDSLGSNITASGNTAVGFRALRVSDAANNTAVGVNSLNSVTSGVSNTAIGQGTGTVITTGSNNTLVGNSATVNSATASNRTAVGGGASSLVDNSVQIGNTSITDVYFGNETAILHANGSLLTGIVQSVNTQSVGYTLVLTDAGKLIQIDSAGAVALTVPTNASVAFPIGTTIDVVSTQTSTTTVTAAGGVTINTATDLIVNDNEMGKLLKVATNTWVLF